jgi:hypothetical protein
MSDVQPGMNLSVDDARQMIQVYDFNQTDWNANTIPIPDEYTIQFQPSLDQTVLESIANGREVSYATQIAYANRPFGTGYITESYTVSLQQLLPKDSTTTTA